MHLNKVMLYGNLTRNPELKALPSGQQVCSFSIATNRSFKGKDGERKEETEFHNVAAFGRTAEVIGQYLKKGRAIYVEGRLQTRSWDKDGTKVYRTEIIADTFQFGADNGADGSQRDTAPSAKAAPVDSSDNGSMDEINPADIPF